jgi:hypothetical protein
MRNLEFSALRLQQRLIQLHEGKDISSSGRIVLCACPTTQPVSPPTKNSVKITAGRFDHHWKGMDDKNIYYSVAKVQAYSTAGSIRLVVRIPLRGSDRVMTLYRVESLPTYSALNR